MVCALVVLALCTSSLRAAWMESGSAWPFRRAIDVVWEAEKGSGDELAEVVRHRVVGQRRLSEITLDKMLQVEPVADGQRLVETVMSLEGGDCSWVGGGLLSQVGRHGVARHQLGENEDDERDSYGQQHERRSTAEQEAQEACRGTGPTPRSRRVGHGGRRRRQGLTIVQRRATALLAQPTRL
jgi:hypothetical protein